MLWWWLVACAPTGLEAWGAPGLRAALQAEGVALDGCVTDSTTGMVRVQCQGERDGHVVRAMWARFDGVDPAERLVAAGGGHRHGRAVVQVEVHDVGRAEAMLEAVQEGGARAALVAQGLTVGRCVPEGCVGSGPDLQALVVEQPGRARERRAVEGVWTLDDGAVRWVIDVQRPETARALQAQLGGR